MLENLGLTYALTGAAVATFLAGIGSSVGLCTAARAASGILSEKPERYGSLMLMVLLSGIGTAGIPATQVQHQVMISI